MTASGEELEVKFFLLDLHKLEVHLQSLDAQCVQPRVHEHNLRFDTPDRELSRNFCALRLRLDTAARLTYKGPSVTRDGVRTRREIEFTVSDFTAAKKFLESLGYEVSLIYEKFRTTYQLEDVMVTLDEMPFGTFAEIEGPGGSEIRAACAQLSLDWQARELASYIVLFDRARQALDFQFRDLTFRNFQDLHVPPDAMGVRPADGGDARWPQGLAGQGE